MNYNQFFLNIQKALAAMWMKNYFINMVGAIIGKASWSHRCCNLKYGTSLAYEINCF